MGARVDTTHQGLNNKPMGHAGSRMFQVVRVKKYKPPGCCVGHLKLNKVEQGVMETDLWMVKAHTLLLPLSVSVTFGQQVGIVSLPPAAVLL